MKPFKSNKTFSLTKFTWVLAVIKVTCHIFYIPVTNWMMCLISATKCAISKTSNIASIALISKTTTRIGAISERPVIDLINPINHFSGRTISSLVRVQPRPPLIPYMLRLRKLRTICWSVLYQTTYSPIIFQSQELLVKVYCNIKIMRFPYEI